MAHCPVRHMLAHASHKTKPTESILCHSGNLCLSASSHHPVCAVRRRARSFRSVSCDKANPPRDRATHRGAEQTNQAPDCGCCITCKCRCHCACNPVAPPSISCGRCRSSRFGTGCTPELHRDPHVRVVVRVRPCLKHEAGARECVFVGDDHKTLEVSVPCCGAETAQPTRPTARRSRGRWCCTTTVTRTQSDTSSTPHR